MFITCMIVFGLALCFALGYVIAGQLADAPEIDEDAAYAKLQLDAAIERERLRAIHQQATA